VWGEEGMGKMEGKELTKGEGTERITKEGREKKLPKYCNFDQVFKMGAPLSTHFPNLAKSGMQQWAHGVPFRAKFHLNWFILLNITTQI